MNLKLGCRSFDFPVRPRRTSGLPLLARIIDISQFPAAMRRIADLVDCGPSSCTALYAVYGK